MARDIVLIIFDCWRYDAIDRMARLSTYFRANGYTRTDMVCQAASTWFAFPSIHASLYSPQAYTQTGTLTDRVEPLARILSNAGYDTAGFVGANPYANLWTDGFDEFWNSDLLSDDRSWWSSLVEKYSLYRLKYLGLRERTPIGDLSARALEWYESSEKPRFLWMHVMDTHEPYLPGLRDGLDIGLLSVYKAFYRHMMGREGMAEETLETHRHLYEKTLDRVQRPLIDFLDSLDEDATVIVTGDHGQEIERGWHAHARMYDEVLRVPFCCRWTLDSDVVYPDGPVRQIDVAPTLVDGLGLDRPPQWEGRPIDGDDRESFSIGDYSYFDRAYAALRTADRKLIKSFDHETLAPVNSEYYDLVEDPGETENRYPNGPACARLEDHLTEFLQRDDIRLDIYSHPPRERTPTRATTSRLRDLGYID